MLCFAKCGGLISGFVQITHRICVNISTASLNIVECMLNKIRLLASYLSLSLSLVIIQT